MGKEKYDIKKYLFYDIHRILGICLWYLWFRPKYYYVGKDTKEKIKKFRHSGGAVIINNHTSFADPTYIQLVLAVRHHNIIAAKDVMKNKYLRWLCERLCSIFVNREAFAPSEFKQILRVLKKGHIIHFFAEGKINENPEEILEFKDGAALFGFLANVPLIPVYIKKRESKFERLKIVYNTPIYASDLGITNKSEINKMTVFAREKMIEAKKYLEGEIKK